MTQKLDYMTLSQNELFGGPKYLGLPTVSQSSSEFCVDDVASGVCDVCDDAISGDFDDDDVTSCGVAFVSMNLIACSSVSRPLATTLSPT